MNLNKAYIKDLLDDIFHEDAFDEECFECKYYDYTPARSDEPERVSCEADEWQQCPKIQDMLELIKEGL